MINRLNPRTRLVATVLFAVLMVGLSQIFVLSGAALLSILAAVMARLDIALTLRRLLALDGFMLLTLVMLPFTVAGDTAFSLFGLEASAQGLYQAGTIFLKANAVMLMILAMIGTMDLLTLGQALHALKAPAPLIHIYLFTVRYLDVLHREYSRLSVAMRARAFTMGTNLHTWQSIGYLFGMLLIRSLDRAERIVDAMRCRGFEDHFPTMDPPPPFQRHDLAFAMLATALAGALLIAERFGFGPLPAGL